MVMVMMVNKASSRAETSFFKISWLFLMFSSFENLIRGTKMLKRFKSFCPVPSWFVFYRTFMAWDLFPRLFVCYFSLLSSSLAVCSASWDLKIIIIVFTNNCCLSMISPGWTFDKHCYHLTSEISSSRGSLHCLWLNCWSKYFFAYSLIEYQQHNHYLIDILKHLGYCY